MAELYIGLMSGTSADGVDAALVDFSKEKPTLLATTYEKYSPNLRQEILNLCQPGLDEINRLGKLDVKLGKLFAATVNTLLNNQQIHPHEVRAIGNHGQTIRHHPAQRFSLQIGDSNIIAAETGITTIADFRRRDIAHGGQGAPLVPAFHQSLFAKQHHNRVIVNIGGIANITLLPANGGILGFDTGPGNLLLDAWAEKHLQQPCDYHGAWAAQGKIHRGLLTDLMSDPFFQLPPPKSTGREYFSLDWLQAYLPSSIDPIDVQTTLVELTAQTILNAITFPMGEVFICGGGVYNKMLMSRLKALGHAFVIDSTEKLGVNPFWVESIAFAWLAKQTLEKKPSNIMLVTGAKQTSILGSVYFV